MNKSDKLGDVLADVAVSAEVFLESVQALHDFDLRGLPKAVQSAVEEVRERLADLCLEEVLEKVDDVLAVIDGDNEWNASEC